MGLRDNWRRTDPQLRFMAVGFVVVAAGILGIAILAADDPSLDSCRLYDFVPAVATPARCIPALAHPGGQR